MKHNNSFWAARADTWCLVCRWADSRLRPQSFRPARATGGKRLPRQRSAPTSDLCCGESLRTAEACRKTFRGSSCSRCESLAPLSRRRRCANELHDGRRAETDSERISQSPLPARLRVAALARKCGWKWWINIFCVKHEIDNTRVVGVEDFSFVSDAHSTDAWCYEYFRHKRLYSFIRADLRITSERRLWFGAIHMLSWWRRFVTGGLAINLSQFKLSRCGSAHFS